MSAIHKALTALIAAIWAILATALISTPAVSQSISIAPVAYGGGQSGYIAPRPVILRAASPSNQFGGTPQTGLGAVAMKWPIWIGSGDMTELRFVTQNFGVGLTAIQTPGNAVTYNETWLVSDATNQAVRITWGGSTTLTMADGDSYIVSDPVLPAAFGLSRFARDAKFWITADARFAGKIVQHNFAVPVGAQAIGFNPANTTITNLASKDGFASTGTAPIVARAFSIMAIGRFATGDPRTYGGIGDSIMEGVGDRVGSTPNAATQGYFGRALWSVNGTSGARGGINYGFSGGKIDLWVVDSASYPKLKPYLALTNSFVEEYGTNSFGNTNTGNPNFYLTQSRTLWTRLLTDGTVAGGRSVYIVRTKLGPRSTGAWSASDGSDQAFTNFATWTVGGDIDLVNTSLQANEGQASRYNKWLDPGTYVRLDPLGGTSSINYHKWVPGLVGDGVHPNATAAEGIAEQFLRPAFVAAEAVN